MRSVLFCLLLPWAFAAHAQAMASHPVGSLIEVRLDQVHPTQAVVGFDEIYSKLGSIAADRSVLFDEYCNSNGQGKAAQVPSAANIQNPASFKCNSAVGTHPEDMKSVAVGPGDQLYLTDGHHSFTLLWEQPGAGPSLKMWVRVVADYSDSATPAAFWQRMQAAHKVWLKDGNGQPLQAGQLPARLGLKNLQNDPYRSLVGFLRKAAYSKSQSAEVAPEFLEFYWGDWLRPQLPLAALDLNSVDGYRSALLAAGKLMVAAGASTTIDNGFTAEQLGGMAKLKEKALEKNITEKVAAAVAYKSTLTGRQAGR